MKKYTILDLQYCNFMEDTYKKPMTMNSLRARFWSLNDVKTNKYSQFNKEFIEDNWLVKFKTK